MPCCLSVSACPLLFLPKELLFKNLGQGVLGFGFVFLSIKIMIEAMTPLQGNELFRQVIIALTDTPLIGILLSAGVTALIHSSAATIGIALVLASSSLISLHAAIYIVLGANIGTCATAFLASLRSPAEARRVAWAHLLFKVFGVLLFIPFLAPFAQLVTHHGP